MYNFIRFNMASKKLFVAIFMLIIVKSFAANYPTLPQIFIQSKYDPPVNGKIFSVATSVELYYTLDNSN